MTDGFLFSPADKATVIELIPLAAAMVTGRKVNRSQVITAGNGTQCFVPAHISGAYHSCGGVGVRPLSGSERNFVVSMLHLGILGDFRKTSGCFRKIIEPLYWQIKACCQSGWTFPGSIEL